ncbi:acyl-CoA-binding protein [Ramlibacter sp. AW1]|uniref:Acyl-CoA-binding protein n=1 Tax=Ramlibacter aurantiacus TaxID=2801330 RepID=A0A936ZRH2_9BURK|nr:acyl-CoA-binding protein [Ramlibacter aurantiacus]MBL0422275.1 acyl-CoA-binding protein [Ramlibacter aurantiacus]
MSDLSSEFDQAVVRSRQLSARPDNATLLKIYGLYKQATLGDVDQPKPGMGDLVGRAKWDAWSTLRGTPPEEAKRRYVELIDSLE